MVVEQTTTANTQEEAEDILAGWRSLPTFMLAYTKEAFGDGPITVVGLFTVQDDHSDYKVRGQRKVGQVSVNFSFSWRDAFK